MACLRLPSSISGVRKPFANRGFRSWTAGRRVERMDRTRSAEVIMGRHVRGTLNWIFIGFVLILALAADLIWDLNLFRHLLGGID